jgi:hypothetical protein
MKVKNDGEGPKWISMTRMIKHVPRVVKVVDELAQTGEADPKDFALHSPTGTGQVRQSIRMIVNI